MGDAGEGLVDAESRLAERMEEREQEKRQARLGPVTDDPERTRETESCGWPRPRCSASSISPLHEVRRAAVLPGPQ